MFNTPELVSAVHFTLQNTIHVHFITLKQRRLLAKQQLVKLTVSNVKTWNRHWFHVQISGTWRTVATKYV